jgi:hypothetical protein
VGPRWNSDSWTQDEDLLEAKIDLSADLRCWTCLVIEPCAGCRKCHKISGGIRTINSVSVVYVLNLRIDSDESGHLLNCQ